MALSDTWLRDIVDLLQAAALGTEGVDLFEGTLPDALTFGGSVLSVKATGGRGPVFTFDNGFAVSHDFPRFQVLCRDQPEEQIAPFQRASDVYNYLSTHVGYVIGGSYFNLLMPLQTPFDMSGRQADGRYIIGFNVEATRNA